METLPPDLTNHLPEIDALIDSLKEAIVNSNRCNIIRACSNIMYFLSDMLEHTMPDGFEVIIKPFENGKSF